MEWGFIGPLLRNPCPWVEQLGSRGTVIVCTGPNVFMAAMKVPRFPEATMVMKFARSKSARFACRSCRASITEYSPT
jgi:hypothetical protein